MNDIKLKRSIFKNFANGINKMAPVKRLRSENSDLSKKKSHKKRYSESGARQSLIGQQHISGNKTFYTSCNDRIKYKMRLSDLEMNDEHNLEFWKKLTGPAWSLFKVAPLSYIQYNEVQLKRYAVHIKRDLVSNIVDDTKNVEFNAKVSLLYEATEHQNCPPPLLIEVTVSKNRNDTWMKYRGILLSWDVDSEYNLTFSPLLMCIGAASVERIVHKSISHLFDAFIRPLKIPSEDLKWLSVLLCDVSVKDSARVHFVYECPGIDLKHPVQQSVQASIIKSLWNNVHNPESDEVTYEEVYGFYKYLHNQLTKTFGIKFDALKLSELRLPAVTLTCEGKLKIYISETAPKVCSFIKQVALILDTPTPSLSIPVD